ncbi:MAG: hypothetical protein K6G65_02800 [Lachnospiraceae bacterium]|nr:hypothetical protein [Lachnospiraceae bacterium]
MNLKQSKIVLGSMMIAVLLCGCGSNTTFKAGDVDKNTISVNKKGVVRVASVESFDKSYYDSAELEDYLNNVVNTYNDKKGEEVVELTSFEVADKTASAVFKYSGIEYYKELNDVYADYMTVKEAITAGILPEMLKDAESGKNVTLEEVAENGSYHVLAIHEEFDVRVDGKIKYYDNCENITKSEAHTKEDVLSVIIFK